MLQQGGNLDVAFAMAQTARRQLPDNPNSADTLGWAFYQKHVYTSAINLLKEAVKKDPDNALFNYHLGLAYAKNGQAALAKQQLDRVVKINPNFRDVDELRRAGTEAKGERLAHPGRTTPNNSFSFARHSLSPESNLSCREPSRVSISLSSDKVIRPSGVGNEQIRWRMKCDSGEV